jgi:hypothetical protein
MLDLARSKQQQRRQAGVEASLPASVIEQVLNAHMRSWLDVKLRARRAAETSAPTHCCRRYGTRCCPPHGR